MNGLSDTKVKTVAFWLARATDTLITLNEESLQYGWFSIPEALNLPLYPGTKLFFEQVRDGKIVIS